MRLSISKTLRGTYHSAIFFKPAVYRLVTFLPVAKSGKQFNNSIIKILLTIRIHFSTSSVLAHSQNFPCSCHYCCYYLCSYLNSLIDCSWNN